MESTKSVVVKIKKNCQLVKHSNKQTPMIYVKGYRIDFFLHDADLQKAKKILNGLFEKRCTLTFSIYPEAKENFIRLGIMKEH
jgi:hypothetical protein